MTFFYGTRTQEFSPAYSFCCLLEQQDSHSDTIHEYKGDCAYGILLRQQRMNGGARGTPPRSLPRRQNCSGTAKPRRPPRPVQRNCDWLQQPVRLGHARLPPRNLTPLGQTNLGTHWPRRRRPPSLKEQRWAEAASGPRQEVTATAKAGCRSKLHVAPRIGQRRVVCVGSLRTTVIGLEWVFAMEKW